MTCQATKKCAQRAAHTIAGVRICTYHWEHPPKRIRQAEREGQAVGNVNSIRRLR